MMARIFSALNIHEGKNQRRVRSQQRKMAADARGLDLGRNGKERIKRDMVRQKIMIVI